MKADLSALCSPVRRPLRVMFMMFIMMTMMMFLMIFMMMMTHIFNSHITNCLFGVLVKIDTNLQNSCCNYTQLQAILQNGHTCYKWPVFFWRVLPIGGSDLQSAITSAKLDTVNKYLGLGFDWVVCWIFFKLNDTHFVKELAAICFYFYLFKQWFVFRTIHEYEHEQFMIGDQLLKMFYIWGKVCC